MNIILVKNVYRIELNQLTYDGSKIGYDCGFHIALYRKVIAYVGLRQSLADVVSCIHGPITKYQTNILKSIKTSIPNWKWKKIDVDK